MKKVKKMAGFTLAELLIVVAIIAILVAIGIPMFNTAMEKSRETADISNLRAAKAAGAVLHMDGKTIPYTPASGTPVGAATIASCGYACIYDPVKGVLIDKRDKDVANLKPAGKGTAVVGTQPGDEVLMTDGTNNYLPSKNVSNGYIAVLINPDDDDSPVQVTFVKDMSAIVEGTPKVGDTSAVSASFGGNDNNMLYTAP